MGQKARRPKFPRERVSSDSSKVASERVSSDSSIATSSAESKRADTEREGAHMARAAKVAAKAQKRTNFIAKVEQFTIPRMAAAFFRPSVLRHATSVPSCSPYAAAAGSDAASPGHIFRRLMVAARVSCAAREGCWNSARLS